MFFFNDTATTEICSLSLHDALPISEAAGPRRPAVESRLGVCRPYSARAARWDEPTSRRSTLAPVRARPRPARRSEEHTSELQSRQYLVCRLLLEKKIMPPSTLNNLQ